MMSNDGESDLVSSSRRRLGFDSQQCRLLFLVFSEWIQSLGPDFLDGVGWFTRAIGNKEHGERKERL